MDGDGLVNVVRYTLYDDGNGNCPCTLKRSQNVKSDGVAPLSQVSNNYNVEVQNVINSNSTSPHPIFGSTYISGSLKTFDNLYAGLKTPSLFVAYKADGNKIPESSTAITDAATLSTIRTVKVTLNLLSPNAALDTNLRAPVSLSANARVGGNN